MNAIALVFVDGQFNPALSHQDQLPTSVQFSFDHEIRLHFAKNTHCVQPIHLKFLNSGKTISYQTVITAEEHSAATILEEYAAHNDLANATQATVTIDLQPYAQMQYYKCQKNNAKASHQAQIVVTQQQGSKLTLFLADDGSQTVTTDVRVNLQAEEAECDVQGLYILNQDHQHVVNRLHIAHCAARCKSSLFFKGILAKKSKAVLFGKVHVHPQAFNTIADQANHNLLLSPQAEIKSEPHLEIETDEVQCRHGATVGALDPESLFYLRSRGIEQDHALQLLTHAFAMEVMDKIKHAPVRQFIHERVLSYAEL